MAARQSNWATFGRSLLAAASAGGRAGEYTTGKLERLGAQHDEAFDLEELHGRLEAVGFTSDHEYAAYGINPDQISELWAWVQEWLADLGLRLAEPYDDSD
ncbi:hypothetical protein [Streptomyces sp. NPDC054794]